MHAESNYPLHGPVITVLPTPHGGFQGPVPSRDLLAGIHPFRFQARLDLPFRPLPWGEEARVSTRVIREKPAMKMWVLFINVREGDFELITIPRPDPRYRQIDPPLEPVQFLGRRLQSRGRHRV